MYVSLSSFSQYGTTISMIFIIPVHPRFKNHHRSHAFYQCQRFRGNRILPTGIFLILPSALLLMTACLWRLVVLVRRTFMLPVTVGLPRLQFRAGLPDVPFNSVLIDPVNPRVIYAGGDMGVYVSNNRGLSWYDFNNGMWDATEVFDLQVTSDKKNAPCCYPW